MLVLANESTGILGTSGWISQMNAEEEIVLAIKVWIVRVQIGECQPMTFCNWGSCQGFWCCTKYYAYRWKSWIEKTIQSLNSWIFHISYIQNTWMQYMSQRMDEKWESWCYNENKMNQNNYATVPHATHESIFFSQWWGNEVCPSDHQFCCSESLGCPQKWRGGFHPGLEWQSAFQEHLYHLNAEGIVSWLGHWKKKREVMVR